jgi:hypothetical protein
MCYFKIRTRKQNLLPIKGPFCINNKKRWNDVMYVSPFYARRRSTLTGGSPQLPLTLKSLTSVFGMGTGVTSSLSSPSYSTCIFIFGLACVEEAYDRALLGRRRLFWRNSVPSKLDNGSWKHDAQEVLVLTLSQDVTILVSVHRLLLSSCYALKLGVTSSFLRRQQPPRHDSSACRFRTGVFAFLICG